MVESVNNLKTIDAKSIQIFNNLLKIDETSSARHKAFVYGAQCNIYATQFERILIPDIQEYDLEMNDAYNELEKIQEEREKEIKNVQKEANKLNQKANSDDGITDEEETKLENLNAKIGTLEKDKNAELSSKQANINTKSESLNKTIKYNIDVATKQYDKTIEVAQPLSETRISGGFFKKLFGITGKRQKKTGEKALKSAEQLKTKVNEYSEIANQKIKTKTK